ncbi:hypothetical protein BV898_14891 [Hypsibius exemplaris]|uniref:Uncharacterized protein n=1 Tax=Hypsibius exemplaris TaxID=2072580 RepID=A0A9X6N9K0_HYPEX|nr:hypothetical protein BV898_14891 [Hypsibius exemplaris]
MHGLAARWRRTPVVAFVGDSRIRQLRDEFIYQISGTDTDNIANKKLKVDQVWTLNGKSRPPDVLVIGAGVWKARLCVQMPKLWDSCLVKYKQAFKDLLPLLAELSATTDVIWLPIGSVNETTMLKRVNRVFNVSMTNVKLALLNEAVAEVMSSMPTGRVEYWESKYHSIQLLTNRMCNSLDHEFQERKSCLRFLEQFHFDDPYCCTAV